MGNEIANTELQFRHSPSASLPTQLPIGGAVRSICPCRLILGNQKGITIFRETDFLIEEWIRGDITTVAKKTKSVETRNSPKP